MDIILRVTFGEREATSLLNWLARCNARLILERPDVPLLYDAGVSYEREEVETWCDILQLLVQRWEDCDGLAAARAGELLARGWKALRPGEPGYERAKALRLRTIRAEVCLTTRVLPGEHGTYHCIVRYEVDGRVFWDDPSARLGMLPERLTARQAHERVVGRVRIDRGEPATLAQRRAADARARELASLAGGPFRFHPDSHPRRARRA